MIRFFKKFVFAALSLIPSQFALAGKGTEFILNGYSVLFVEINDLVTDKTDTSALNFADNLTVAHMQAVKNFTVYLKKQAGSPDDTFCKKFSSSNVKLNFKSVWSQQNKWEHTDFMYKLFEKLLLTGENIAILSGYFSDQVAPNTGADNVDCSGAPWSISRIRFGG